MCEALTFLLDNIYIRFGSKLYRQIVGIPMGTNCAPLIADLFLFCYERDFMLSLSEDNQSEVIEAFNSTSLYLDDLLNIDNNFYDSMVTNMLPGKSKISYRLLKLGIQEFYRKYVLVPADKAANNVVVV